MKPLTYLSVAILIAALAGYAQVRPEHPDGVFVDPHGVLRWKDTREEVRLFGVNYTTPFAYSYRAHKRLGLSLKRAIDLDVAQMSRLGLDGYRVHVWDREITDGSGNLLQNEHLDLLDYLLARLAERGITTILTPIAWWGNGWPEPDERTDGFSQGYSKLELVTNHNAREAQRRYLKQFIEHTNPYRKMTCINDPSIIALEIINEPNHPADDSVTTGYINEMAGVLHEAGFAKPIFYNISENWSDRQANAIARADVEGVSFQWYPTDLVHGKRLVGNFLTNVNRYLIPSAGIAGYDRKAKMVYEFDAADVTGSYMYPAMVRSFREAGMQFAAMFSYDPSQIAWSNTEYPTHYVNLLYTPSKAISLMIAANAFRDLPRMKSYGDYPENNRFQNFRVSYDEDLSEMNSASAFIYSKSTQSQPKDPRSLRRVAGVGDSRLVQYEGTGAYFLDWLEDGVWRLEVYPDVLWLRDPFETTSLSRQVARLFWRERRIRIALPDLGGAYALWPLSSTGVRSPARLPSGQLVRPGVYLAISATAGEKRAMKYLSSAEGFLEGLYVPPAAAPGVYVVNRSQQYALESACSPFAFQIAGEDSITKATLFVRRPGWRGFARHPLKDIGRFTYGLTDTPRVLQAGQVEYCVAVEAAGTTLTFPEGVTGTPGTWDFSAGSLWTMKVMRPREPVVLLDIVRDRRDLVFPHFSPSLRYVLDFTNGPKGEDAAVSLSVKFFGTSGIPFGFQASVAELLKPFAAVLEQYHRVIVTARSLRDTAACIRINFLTGNGKNYSTRLEISSDWCDITVPISAFRTGASLMLPDHYPRFLPKLWDAHNAEPQDALDLRMLDRIQIIVDPADARQDRGTRELSFEISSIRLVP